MRTITAILPVYNEEVLIKPCLEHLMPCVDEIIVIDGSATGPSTDSTAEIAKSFDKVKYLSGTFKTIPGEWDAGSQKNRGIAEASSDVLLFLSADMFFYNLEFLCETIREETAKVFFCLTTEFWLDTTHVRMYATIDNLSIPGFPQEAVAISRDAQPMATQYGSLETVAIKPKEQVLVTNTIKYHLGWIRSFGAQVRKHVQHVNQGRWGETGAALLSGTEQKLEQWAYMHVASYKTVPSVELRCVLPEEWEFMKSMTYQEGEDEALKAYTKKWGTSPFRGARK